MRIPTKERVRFSPSEELAEAVQKRVVPHVLFPISVPDSDVL